MGDAKHAACAAAMSAQAASRAVQRRGPMRVRVIRVKRGFSSALTVIALFAYDVGGVHVCRVHHQARPAAPTGSWPLRSRREIRYVSARQASITCGRGRAAGVVLGAATGRRGSRSMAPTLLALELDVLSTMTEYTAVHSAVRDATCSKFVLDRLAQMRPCCASQDHTLC